MSQVEVVKWYTKARKFPQLVGRTPDGTRIPGGPYTQTQLIGAGLTAFALKTTTGIWAQFGLITNVVVALVALAAVVFALGKAPIGARNPFLVAMAAQHAITAPAAGRMGRHTFYLPRPSRQLRPAPALSRRVRGKASQNQVTPALGDIPAQPAPTQVLPVTPTPAASATDGGAPSVSQVQLLLAGTES